MKSGRGLRLLLEAAQALPVAHKFIAHHLDGNIANQPNVPGPVYLAHATGADGLKDLIFPRALRMAKKSIKRV
jgi:hypothetical protein